MNSSLANKLFDESLALKEGDAIRISCSSRADQDSTRSQLYRVRRNYEKHNPETGVIIQRATYKTGFFVILQLSPTQVIEHVSAQGYTQPLFQAATPATEQARVGQLMRDDGYSEEDIMTMLEQGE